MNAKQTIQYAGKLCKFELEVNTIDEAQRWLDYYRKLDFQSACLHEGNKHQVYVETQVTICPECGDRMFPSIFDKTKNYCVMCDKNYPREES